MKKEVEIVFDSFINQIFKDKPEIAKYLLRHERRPLVINSCCEQIAIAEGSNIKKTFDVSKYRLIIGECAKIFGKVAVNHAEQSALSRLERIRQIEDAHRLDKIAEEFAEDQKELFAGS